MWDWLHHVGGFVLLSCVQLSSLAAPRDAVFEQRVFFFPLSPSFLDPPVFQETLAK